MARTTAEKQPTEPAPPEPDEAEETPADDASGEPKAPEPAESEPSEDAESGHEECDSEEEPSEDAESGHEEGDSEEKPSGHAEAETTRVGKARRISDPVLLIATVLVVVAAACAGYFGWSWYRAAHDGSLAYSRDRDVVLRAAEQGVQNMNTLDYRKVDRGLASWEDSSTGDLHQQLVQGRAQFTAQVRLAKTVTTAKILDGAVTELDDRAGKAGVIVAVQVTVTPPTGTPTTKPSRMRAQLTRTPSGWKLSALGQAPVGTTAG